MFCECKWILFKNQLRQKPTDSHDLTFRTFITASSHLHFKKTVCSILRNKLTKNFRSFCILNLRLQRQDQHVKDVNFFVYNEEGTILSLYSTRLRKLTHKLTEDALHSSVTVIFGRLLPILYCGPYHAISVWSRTSVPPTYTAVKGENFFGRSCVTPNAYAHIKAAYFKAKSLLEKRVSGLPWGREKPWGRVFQDDFTRARSSFF